MEYTDGQADVAALYANSHLCQEEQSQEWRV